MTSHRDANHRPERSTPNPSPGTVTPIISDHVLPPSVERMTWVFFRYSLAWFLSRGGILKPIRLPSGSGKTWLKFAALNRSASTQRPRGLGRFGAGVGGALPLGVAFRS